MSKILISYRREDSAYVIDRIDERLVQEFGRQAVFLDVDSIPHGVDFRKYLDEQVAKCEVFLAVIGPDWMGPRDSQGKTRLEDPADFVRIEVESALKRQIPVIPVLVRGASIPPAEQLPTSIQDLPYRHGLAVRSGADFRNDMDRLIASLTQQIRGLIEAQPKPDTHAKPVQKKTKPSTPATPVDMVKVPKGPFLYGEDNARTVIDYDYWIDKYPVTNEKYRAFVLTGGYENRQYWSPEGWGWKTKECITGPAYWNDTKWNKANHPVVGVSYYEAEAYATWAGKRLPTEQEREKAARGEDGRQYPWGEEFDKDKCNMGSLVAQTTPVSLYANGVSPYGCYDMAGNVWEWNASWYEHARGERVVRGGSWNCNLGYFRIPSRVLWLAKIELPITDHLIAKTVWPSFLRASKQLGLSVDYRGTDVGFRLAQDIP